MKISIAIIIGAIIIGAFYSYTEHEKLLFADKQAQIKIQQETQIKQETKQQEQENAEAIIKEKCSSFLNRNGNYLVTNETLETNYNSCLHANGL